MNRRSLLVCVMIGLAGLGLRASTSAFGLAQGGSRTFPETGKTVSGQFLTYWQQHGGLAQQGYPISGEMAEKSDLNGQTYTVQYFERAVFEKHPENRPPFDTLLSQLGTYQYRQKYPDGAPNQRAGTDNARLFPETGKHLGGKFRTYWEEHGGLAQQGYPISEEFSEQSDLNGQTYTVQYFERAVFELHPENAGTPFEVLLSQLGTFQYRARYQGGSPTATAVPPTTTVPPTPSPVVPTATVPPTPLPSIANVEMGSYTFNPSHLTVPVNTKVIWTNTDAAAHNVTNRAGLFASGSMPQGAVFSHTFTTAGTYPYTCTFHIGMDGVVEVTP